MAKQKRKLMEAEEVAEALLGYRDPTDRTFQAGVILVLGMGRLKNTYNMQRDSGYPKDAVLEICRNLKANGIWASGTAGVKDKLTYVAEFWDGSVKGQVAFTLDALCGAGEVQRLPGETWTA